MVADRERGLLDRQDGGPVNGEEAEKASLISRGHLPCLRVGSPFASTIEEDIDMARNSGNSAQLQELLCQTLETEMGGVKVYETALSCAVNEDLKKEWGEYFEQT